SRLEPQATICPPPGPLLLPAEADALDDDGSAGRSIGGRLAADWLAWSAQLGRAPGRVVCLAAEDLGSAGHAATLGRAVGNARPGASGDRFRVPDPVEATLRRLQEQTAGGKPRRSLPASAGIDELAARPGRAHMWMYRWTGLALLIAAVALVILGVRLRGGAAEASSEARELIASQRDRVADLLPPTADLNFPSLAAQTELTRLRALRPSTEAIEPVRPVILAVDEIGAAVAVDPDTQLERVTIAQSFLSVQVSGPETRSVEFVPQALQGGTTLFEWQPSEINQRGNRYRTTINGIWSDPDAEAPGS
ncbi:MAG: hypothetical protein AAGF47_04360, partial [Planctomycetota bacterium]